MTNDDIVVLEKHGWEVECQSPLEIRHKDDGSFATKGAALAILCGLKREPMLEYETLVESLQKLPITWYPGLLRELVVAAYKKNKVFQPGGASRLIARVEVELGETAKTRTIRKK